MCAKFAYVQICSRMQIVSMWKQLKLQVTKKVIKSRMISISGQSGPLVLELLAFERWKCFPWTYNGENVMNTIAPSFFIIKLAGKQDNIKVQTIPDTSFHWLPSYLPLSTGKNIVDTIAASVLIGSSSNLQTKRTAIKSWASSISGQSRLFASELHALVR